MSVVRIAGVSGGNVGDDVGWNKKTPATTTAAALKAVTQGTHAWRETCVSSCQEEMALTQYQGRKLSKEELGDIFRKAFKENKEKKNI